MISETQNFSNRLYRTKHSIFTPEFAHFIDCIGSEGQKHEDFSKDYDRMCKKVRDILEGEKTVESVLALAFHLTAIMSIDEHSKLLDKIKENNKPSYIE